MNISTEKEKEYKNIPRITRKSPFILSPFILDFSQVTL